ncbi:helicase-related protein [Candidatus Laterigemmans baculatus]|uniref:helicase-related protein n=1 Tax=Candidatus Laterigemmans baculatus TaxID=2770505 RepID=UPI00193C1683
MGSDVTTFVTHSSLSQEQRHQAEQAFAPREDCVIVATSVLELGVDVGNLDRVIQIDSPPASCSGWAAPGDERAPSGAASFSPPRRPPSCKRPR